MSDSLLQTLSSCRTEYFGRLDMVKVSFGVESGGRGFGRASGRLLSTWLMLLHPGHSSCGSDQIGQNSRSRFSAFTRS